MLQTLIDKALKNTKDITGICLIGNQKYIDYLELDKQPITSLPLHIILLDAISFQELVKKVSDYEENMLLVMVMPLWIEGSSREEVFRWLMELEEKGRSILNISMGVESLELEEKLEAQLAKLFKKIALADNGEIQRNNQLYYKRLHEHKKLMITDSNGSRITFEVEKVIVENDCLEPENKVIQIPAGEVFVVPKKGSVDGVLVLKKKEGEINIAIEKDFADLSFIDKSFYLPVGEVGFGTNPWIPDIWNLPYLEKRNGTFHLGFGRNKNFGGEYVQDIHFDIVSNAKEFNLEMYEENCN